jgi:hypothetical protein
MSSDPANPGGSNLEIRIAAIEDKLSKMGVTQADIQAFQKVSSLAAPALSPTVCTTCFHCVVSIPVSVPVHVHTGIAQQSQPQQAGGSAFEKLGT